MNADAPNSDDLLALRLRALGHPARLAILRALAERDRCVCGEIVRGLPLAQSTVSQHLKVLKEAGLIAGTVEGPRSCYCLDRDALAGLSAELSALFASAAAPVPAAPAPGALAADRAAAPLHAPAGCNPPMRPKTVSMAVGDLASAVAPPISTASAGELPAGS
ncbi:winged helix-turn-helix transcriptional regulator [Ancylobacter sonchi]|uniref:ArsR/SmtB family transcription factor n=1 Tax=Ancylobacter sonchi TaxID=1937790 RepID=UPI001BD55132|nr:metalloregulator ArsR/SmtB family transcription factor [Ancylobacter sonchi]MBS7535108.1 winged helix-turn-helix transcriptional regulator [Ancylobacter sonchi]